MERVVPAGEYSAAAAPTALLLAVLSVAFLGAALLVYEPAFEGPFLSDDLHYVATNPYVQHPGLESIAAILDPGSPATIFVVNYAPVHLLLHALQWQVFGEQTLGYHVTNVVLHAVASVLLALLLLRAGLARGAAIVGGALFLLHPANVEAVAWISQLKSSAALVLSLLVLLAWPGRPLAATLLFGTALLAKATAFFALPVAALFDWTRGRRIRWGWLGAWAALLALYAVAEFATHNRSGEALPLHPDLGVRARSIVAIAGRYLVMAASGWGVSAFHEPAPAESLVDPWWLGGLLALALLGARTLWALLHRRQEAAWWIWAAVSFVPVSQLFPFLYPMADRYLYFILPGLIGGAALAGRDLLPRAAAWLSRRARPRDAERWRSRLEAAALAGGVALALAFAAHSHERAAVWSDPTRVTVDAALHYPEGRSARLLRARSAARLGDFDAALDELEAAVDGGFTSYRALLRAPEFAPLRDDPRFRALIDATTRHWIEWGEEVADPTQIELQKIAHAHIARGDYAEAERLLERALRMEGPIGDVVARDLESVRRARRDPSYRLVP